MSQTAAIRTPGTCASDFISVRQRPPVPMHATSSVSFAMNPRANSPEPRRRDRRRASPDPPDRAEKIPPRFGLRAHGLSPVVGGSWWAVG